MKLVMQDGHRAGARSFHIMKDGRKVGELYRFWMSGDAFTDGRYYWQVAIEGDSQNSQSFKTFKEAKAYVEGLK